MIDFKGRSVALLAGLVFACADDPPASSCTEDSDCSQGQACVYLSAEATFGACFEPNDGPGPPGSLIGNLWSYRLAVDQPLDVLFIVDNSPAIAPRLPQLAEAAGALVEGLRTASPPLSLRIGVTTTDAGNPRCPAAGERGALRIDTCRAHASDYIDADAGIDASSACTDACSLDSLALEPTYAGTQTLAVRPWLEVIPGGDNLPGGIDLAEAVRCAVPQGISGCEFTSPLASLAHVLARTQDQADPAFGFLRHDADLLVIVVSAGNDCSVAPGHEAIFDDNQVFWGDLQLPDLSPAICWRAGIACDGSGPEYADCRPADLGDDGQPTGADAAVLTPTLQFSALLQEVEDQRRTFDLDASVTLFSVAGVPPGYPEGQALVYADSDDPAFQDQHGIGPGCSDGIAAPPPVRLLAAGAAHTLDDLSAESICRDDWTESFTRLAEAAAAKARPHCYTRCARDTDSDTPELDPRCEVMGSILTESRRFLVPECVREDDAWVGPAGSPRCFVAHTGDALDPRCAEDGSNVEFELVLAEPDPPGTFYEAGCEISPLPGLDCPDG